MEKKIILIGIIIIVLSLFLTGCYTRDDAGVDTDGDSYPDSEDEFPNDPTEWIDTDNDGFGNNVDDFPNNASLHEIFYLHNSIGTEKSDEPWLISSGQNKELIWLASEEWKFVFLNCSTQEFRDEEWIFQPICPKITLTSPVNTYTINIGGQSTRIPITPEIVGEWEFRVVNSCENQIRVNFVLSMYR